MISSSGKSCKLDLPYFKNLARCIFPLTICISHFLKVYFSDLVTYISLKSINFQPWRAPLANRARARRAGARCPPGRGRGAACPPPNLRMLCCWRYDLTNVKKILQILSIGKQLMRCPNLQLWSYNNKIYWDLQRNTDLTIDITCYDSQILWLSAI